MAIGKMTDFLSRSESRLAHASSGVASAFASPRRRRCHVEQAEGADVKRVLITGMSGTGKSTVIAELAARGYNAVDTDYGGLSEVVSVPHDQQTGLGRGQDWVWREDRIQAFLAAADTNLLFLAGCAPNQGMYATDSESDLEMDQPRRHQPRVVAAD